MVRVQSGPSSGRKWYFSLCFHDFDGFIQVSSIFGIILGFHTGFTKKSCFGFKSSWFHRGIFEIRTDFGLI